MEASCEGFEEGQADRFAFAIHRVGNVTMPSRKMRITLWLLGYALLISAIISAMLWQRQEVLTTMSTAEARSEWDTWRDDVIRQQSNPGPVQRRIPKSAEPPALVLMRDYFAVSLVGATFFTSLLYWIVAWLVSGALSSSSHPANNPSANS